MTVDWQLVLTGIAVTLAGAHVCWSAVKTFRLPVAGRRCGSCRGCNDKPVAQMIRLVTIQPVGTSRDDET